MCPRLYCKKKRKMTTERITELIDRKSLTPSERAEVLEAADAAGIKYTVKKGCRTCYETILLKLYESQAVTRNVSADGYRLKRVGYSFAIFGNVYNNETITLLKVGNLHPMIVSTYFEKVEDGDVTVS